MTLIKQLGLTLGLILLLIQSSWAVNLAGHVILTKGNVTAIAEDGSARTLKRRSQIFNGDTVKTGPAGSVQVRFVDKALMTIKANSEMNIERYLLAQQGSEGEKEQVLMSLVKGGFRTITGTIGKGDKDAYKVNTPAASIGIRGTNYEVQQESDGGFVMGVYSGGIQVENEAGTIELGEGADFNFTRVKPNGSPKGLLAPPPALGKNTATEQNEEESQESADKENTDNSEGDENSEGDSDTESDEKSDTDSQDAQADTSTSENENNALAGIDNPAADIGNDVTNAIDNKLADTIQETADKVEEILIDQGIIGTFDFNDPYRGIDATNSDNPFLDDVITDEQYALAESGKLAVLAIPVNSTNSYAGDSPSISTLEAQLVSPDIVSSSEHSFASDPGKFRLSYEVYNLTTKQTDRYEIEVVVDAETGGNGGLEFFIDNALTSTTYRLNDQEVTASVPGHIDIQYDPINEKYSFLPVTNDPDNFILEMELNFDDDGQTPSAATLALQQELGSGTNFDRDDWYAESGLDMVIGNGSWDNTNNKPILVMRDKHSYQNQDGTTVNEERIEVVSKPLEADSTVNSLLAFAACADSTPQQTCDIQVDSVAAGKNIRWGAWLAEPGEGIQLNEFKVNDNTLEFREEENILAFWVAAERADINQLIGNATFTADSDCAKFNQCIGFADDGIVQSLTAQFDVNFTSGAITNGNLTLQTTEDPDLGILGGTGTVMSTWNVNFSGQMSTTDDGTTKLPEFQTNSIANGKIDGVDTDIIGNIGGIFVKPGDKFAGGYNLGTADGTNKHAAGVFSLDKQ